MEQLESCRVAEVGVVGVRSKSFVGVCSILERQVCGEIPEATCSRC